MPIIKYGCKWELPDELAVELSAIRLGGKWKSGSGNECGEGLFAHYKAAQKLCWPLQDHHRWSDLSLRNILEHRMCGLMGPGSSNKTFSAAKYALIDYWAFPHNTLILVSSTDLRGLELRVWGKIKELFNEAFERYPWLDGHPVDYLKCITTDDLEENLARTLTKGIICVPCMANGKYVGLSKYIGVKSPRLRLIADECQLMGPSFLDATANLQKNPDWKFVPIGNPTEQEDPLGLACEPQEGWTAMPEPTRTTVWKTKFLNGVCVNFVGTDSPNFDFPQDKAPRYNYLPSKQSIDEIVQFWGKDSWHFSSQAVGVMRTGLQARRVITRDLCKEHHAQEKAIWGGTTLETTKLTRIYAIDAAYGGQGGDRCVGGYVEFGQGNDGWPILRVNPPVIVPVSVRRSQLPEDQIAEFVLAETQQYGIPPENIFYDSTGRGTLGSAFARVFGTRPPTPVEFGGRPDKRPVRHDLYVVEGRDKRLKTCDEHYLDKVSQLWFTARYVIEADQMRELPEEVMKEGCSREFGVAGANKLFVESKHDPKARERMKRSPDLFDWLVTAIEGAVQRGFKVLRLGMEFTEGAGGRNALDELARSHQQLWRKKQLNYR